MGGHLHKACLLICGWPKTFGGIIFWFYRFISPSSVHFRYVIIILFLKYNLSECICELFSLMFYASGG